MSAWQFLRETVQRSSGGGLAQLAACQALVVACDVGFGTTVVPGWRAAVVITGMLAVQAGIWWWLLGNGRVQRWIREG
jgi:hypothetical protein